MNRCYSPLMDNGNALGSGERKTVDSNYFEKEINTAYACHTLKLVSVDKDKHLNVVIKDNHGQLGATLNIFGIKELRDTLNELFPSEEKKLGDSEYYVEPGEEGLYQWQVRKRFFKQDDDFVAGADNNATAVKIAQALNEAEGL